MTILYSFINIWCTAVCFILTVAMSCFLKYHDGFVLVLKTVHVAHVTHSKIHINESFKSYNDFRSDILQVYEYFMIHSFKKNGQRKSNFHHFGTIMDISITPLLKTNIQISDMPNKCDYFYI